MVRIICLVKPYHIFKRKISTFCRKASLPFPGEMDLGCGITFDILPMIFTGFVLNLLNYCHDLKEDLMGTKFFIIFVKYVVYDWG